MTSGLSAGLSEHLEGSIDLDFFYAEYISDTLDKPLLLWNDGLRNSIQWTDQYQCTIIAFLS